MYMKKLIKYFGQDDSCQELYILQVMVKVNESDGGVSLQELKDEIEDFHYDRVENGFIHATTSGQFLTLKHKVNKLLESGWKSNRL